jgi:pimeloyl-ACP methyl ester carboxylesterase
VPVLVIQGDRDIIRPEYSVSLSRLLPNAQLAILPNSDHFAVMAHPNEVLAVVKPFLEAK